MTVLMALGAALVVITSTETVIAGNFRSGRQAFYAAEAAVELAVAELRTRAHWTASRRGYRTVAVRRRRAGRRPRALPPDAPVDLTAVREPCQLRRARAVRRRAAVAAFRLRAPSGSGAPGRLRLRRSTSWRSSPGARQNRARPSSRSGRGLRSERGLPGPRSDPLQNGRRGSRRRADRRWPGGTWPSKTVTRRNRTGSDAGCLSRRWSELRRQAVSSLNTVTCSLSCR